MNVFTVLHSTRFEDVRVGDRITIHRNGVTVTGNVIDMDGACNWIELGSDRALRVFDIDVGYDEYTLVRIERPDGSPTLPDVDGVYQRTEHPIMHGGPLIIRRNGAWTVSGERYEEGVVQVLFPLQRMVGGDL